MSGCYRIGWAVGCALLLVVTPAKAAPCEFCQAPCDLGCWNDGGESPADGRPSSWAEAEIPVLVNLSDLVSLQEGLDRDDVLAAIEAALETYERIPCSRLRFSAPIESSATESVSDSLLIHFTRTGMGDALYNISNQTRAGLHSTPVGEHNSMLSGYIRLNCKERSRYSFDWTTQGAESGKIDIQSFITFALPRTLGFLVGTDENLPWAYNAVKHDLCQPHQDMVRFLYFHNDRPGCTPPKACSCGGETCIDPPATPAADYAMTEAGVPMPSDAGSDVGLDGGSGRPAETGASNKPGGDSKEAGVGSLGDGGSAPGSDEGCGCRVAQRREDRTLPWLLLGLVAALLLGRRRLRP